MKWIIIIGSGWWLEKWTEAGTETLQRQEWNHVTPYDIICNPTCSAVTKTPLWIIWMCAVFVFVYASFLLCHLSSQFAPTTSRIFNGTNPTRAIPVQILSLYHWWPSPYPSSQCCRESDTWPGWKLGYMQIIHAHHGAVCEQNTALQTNDDHAQPMIQDVQPWKPYLIVFGLTLSAYQLVRRCFHISMLRFRNYNHSMRNDAKGWCRENIHVMCVPK